jgi:hypothetical protein
MERHNMAEIIGLALILFCGLIIAGLLQMAIE